MAADHPVSPEQLLESARAGDRQALAELLGLYRNYLKVLARVHIDSTLQAKADPSDLAQETCLQAARDFPQFRGSTEGEFTAWLRMILANRGMDMLRHYKGSQRRDVAREQQLEAQIDLSAQVLARVAATSHYSPSQSAAHARRLCCWPMPWQHSRSTIARHLSCIIWSNARLPRLPNKWIARPIA